MNYHADRLVATAVTQTTVYRIIFSAGLKSGQLMALGRTIFAKPANVSVYTGEVISVCSCGKVCATARRLQRDENFA